MAARIKPAGVRRDCRCPKVKHEHGTRRAYDADECRCLPCRAAARLRRTENYRRATINRWNGRAEILDATGTRRRLQALAALGWSSAAVGARMGVGFRFVVQLRNSRGMVYRSTAERVAAVYEQLWAGSPGGQYADLVRRHAKERGWPPPLAWDDDTIDDPAAQPYIPVGEPALLDDVAVEEALRGRPVPLTKLEREEAVRRGRARGMTTREIALMLRKPERSVERDATAVAA